MKLTDFRVELRRFSIEKLDPVLVRRGKGRARLSPSPGPLFFKVMTIFGGLELTVTIATINNP